MFENKTQSFINTVKKNKILTVLLAIWLLIVIILPVNIISKSFAIAAGLNFYAFSLYFGNIFNIPALFISLFLFMISCSQAKLTPIEQNDFSPLTWLTIFSVIISFYATLFIFMKKKKQKDKALELKFTFNSRTLLLTNIIMLVLEIIIYTLAFVKLGGIPLFDDFLRANKMPYLINNWLMTIMVAPGILIIFDIIYIAYKKKYAYFGFILAFLALIMLLGGRINIFIPIITALFYLIFDYHFTKRKYLILIGTILMLIVVVLMIVIPLLRTSVYKSPYQHYYDSIYEEEEEPEGLDFEGSALKVPSVLKPVWVNFSTEMHGFDWMVEILSDTGEYQYGRMFLLGPLNFIFKYFIPQPKVDVLKYKWLNVLTFLQNPYMDFGIFGVIAFIVAYTFVGMKAYYAAISKKSMFAVLFYSYYCMSTLFFVFANHFLYTTYIVNTLLILIFLRFLSVDWIGIAKRIFFKAKTLPQ